MNRKNKASKIIITTLFICLLISNLSIADDNKSKVDDAETHMTTRSTLPDYGPEMFEKARKETNFIAARGTMPIINNDIDKFDWTNQLIECTRNNSEILEYFSVNGGPVESFGTYIDGYLKVGMESTTPEKVNDTVINEIYEIINIQCQKEGINEVPVVFVWEHEEQILLGKSTQNVDSATENTPGFTSISLILCMMILVTIRK